ncbi:MAG: hypothetical protein ACKOAS_09580, partial [Verrucomicrobiota bacterium]
HEAVRGIALNLLRRYLPEDRIRHAWLDRGIQAFTIALAFTVVRLDIPVLYFTSVSAPAFAIVGCFIPVWLVLKVPALAPYRNPVVLGLVALTGVLLAISPLFEFS